MKKRSYIIILFQFNRFEYVLLILNAHLGTIIIQLEVLQKYTTIN